MTQKSRTDLNTQIDANLADNAAGDISEADVRSVLKDQNDSALNLLSDTMDDITEGTTNTFFTNARADARITNSDAIVSDTSGITATQIVNSVVVTQAVYDGLTPNASTMYFIKGS